MTIARATHARSIAFDEQRLGAPSDCPFFHRCHSSRFCADDKPGRPI